MGRVVQLMQVGYCSTTWNSHFWVGLRPQMLETDDSRIFLPIVRTNERFSRPKRLNFRAHFHGRTTVYCNVEVYHFWFLRQNWWLRTLIQTTNEESTLVGKFSEICQLDLSASEFQISPQNEEFRSSWIRMTTVLKEHLFSLCTWSNAFVW